MIISTICSPDYLPQALASVTSAQRYKSCNAVVAVCGRCELEPANEALAELGVKLINAASLGGLSYAKYSGDSLRWALKPTLLIELLKEHEQAVYFDCDVYFVGKWGFLLDDLTGLLLTPHWRPINTQAKEFAFGLVHGYFNAGFVAAGRSSFSALRWWQEACAYDCTVNLVEGVFTDQRYLDWLALEFADVVRVCKHAGCNVGVWSRERLPRTEHEGQLYVDGQPAVFAHLTPQMAQDKALASVHERYADDVERWREWLTEREIDLGASMLWAVCAKTDEGWVGPVDRKVWLKRDGETALELYRSGLLGTGHEFALKPIMRA